jgi:GTP-binding protein
MIITTAEFITSAVKPSQYPEVDFPEVAFSGRSNVGKSSLINILTNRKHLAKTSRTPGRTQLINFFLINKLFSFVDLPGYGYAKVPAAIKKNWAPMIESYLTLRRNLRGVISLIDIRRSPGEEERSLSEWLGAREIPIVWVLTKADKFSRSRQQTRRIAIADEMHITHEKLILFSAKTGQGRDALWAEINTLCQSQVR